MSNNKTPSIKVQLDSKTFITITKMESFDKWKLKYPEAKIIEDLEYFKHIDKIIA